MISVFYKKSNPDLVLNLGILIQFLKRIQNQLFGKCRFEQTFFFILWTWNDPSIVKNKVIYRCKCYILPKNANPNPTPEKLCSRDLEDLMSEEQSAATTCGGTGARHRFITYLYTKMYTDGKQLYMRQRLGKNCCWGAKKNQK